MKSEMNTKTFLVSFLVVVALFTLVVSANNVKGNTLDYDVTDVTVDDVSLMSQEASVVAGETVTVKVYFTSRVDDSDVTVEAQIEGEKVETNAISESFDVEVDNSYRKVLSIEVPYELKDELSDEAILTIEIDGKESKWEDLFVLKIQRPSYNVDIKSVTFSQTIDAGEVFPVDVVLKNVGYNDLDDIYVTASIPALGIEKSSYFGDLVALECFDEDENNNDCDDEDETDTVSGRLFLEVPYDVEAGTYSLEVEVSNDDTTSNAVEQVTITNDPTQTVIVDSLRETVAAGEDAEYSVVLVNPTDKLKVYRVVVESTGDLSTSVSDGVVAVPAGSSKTVTITANAGTEGEYEFSVDVSSGEELVETVSLSMNVTGEEGLATTDPVVILTVVLAIIFIVLLIVLIVLIGKKKPEKAEELGESYY